MECRQFFCDPNALFEPEPLRDILRLQEDAGRLAIVSFNSTVLTRIVWSPRLMPS